MAIDDKLEKVLEQYENEVVAAPGALTIDAAINAIPVIGSSIAALISGKAQERIRERTAEVFGAMKERVEMVEDTAINRDFFETAEFQTLLALAIEQLQTTHDKEKIKFLGTVLANSGFKSFESEDRKELFLRSLRDLMPGHIKLMSELLPANHSDPKQAAILWMRRPKRDKFSETDRLLIQQLVALGFVEETIVPLDASKDLTPFTAFGPKPVDTKRMAELLKKPPNIIYKISPMGRDFLAFIGIVAPSR